MGISTETCVGKIVDKMSDPEKGLLGCILEWGKDLNEKCSDIINDQKKLSEYGKTIQKDRIGKKMNEAFELGVGVMDIFKDIPDNYGKQLDMVINEVLVKALKTSKPYFGNHFESLEGTIAREQWITEKMMESVIAAMDDDTKKEFTKQVEQMLKECGINPAEAAKIGSVLLTGGLTAARSVMGFQFHILTAQIANIVVKSIAGRGLTFAANQVLQKTVSVLFGPVGWIITIIGGLSLITSLSNPRAYDKYIPAVFLIGSARLTQTIYIT